MLAVVLTTCIPDAPGKRLSGLMGILLYGKLIPPEDFLVNGFLGIRRRLTRALFSDVNCITHKIYENLDVTDFTPLVGCGRGTSSMALLRTATGSATTLPVPGKLLVRN